MSTAPAPVPSMRYCQRCCKPRPIGLFDLRPNGRYGWLCRDHAAQKADTKAVSAPALKLADADDGLSGDEIQTLIRTEKAARGGKQRAGACHHAPKEATAKGAAGNAPTDRDVCDTIRALWWGPRRLRIVSRDMGLTLGYRPKVTTTTED